MRKQLLILFLFLFTATLSAQVGVGTANPDPSSQLEVVSSDRGVLIPRVALQSTTDLTTIASGNVNSLVVFNTETINDVEPGYYYWYEDRWYKMATTSDEIITTLIDNEDGTYLYTSEDGTETLIDIPASVVNDIIEEGAVYNEIINLIDARETITIIEDNGDGTYTYYNEDDIDADGTIIGPGVTVDVVGDVVTNITNQGDIYDEILNLIETNETLTVLTDNGDGTFTYTDEAGDDITFDANTTTFTDNGDGTYDFTNANGDSITVDVVGDVVTNIINQGDIYDEIINMLGGEYGNVIYDETENKFYYIDDNGDQQEIDWDDFNTTNESFTLENDQLVITDSDGNSVALDVTEIADNSEFITNLTTNQEFIDEIINLIDLNETLTVLTDNGDGTFTYTDEDGNDITFDANTTDLADNGDGTYTLTNANGDSITVDVVEDVVTNIQNQGDIYNEIINVIEAESDELVDLGNGKYKHIAADGSEVEFDVNTVNLEKVVDADGNVSYIFKDGDDNEITTIDVAGDILENIINEGDIYDEIINLIDINETLTILTDNGDGTFTYTDEDGNDITFDTNTTNLADNGDGTYTLTNANGDSITVDVVEDVVTNIQNQGDIYNEIINVIEAESDELVDLGNGKYKHIAADGSEVEFDVNTVNLEKVVDADGNVSYIFKDSDNNEITTIDVAGDILENIINEGDIYDEIINLIDLNETLTILTDNGDGTFTYTDEDGNDITFDANTTDLADNGDGTYTLTNANGDSITVDVVDDVVTNIQNQGDIYNEIINVIEAESDELVDLGNGKYKHIAVDGTEVEFDVNTVNLEKVVDADGNVSYIFKNGDNNEITTVDVAGDILENIINEGDIYDEIINLIDINETLTVLTDNGDGTFTYTDEDGDDITFDANTTDLADNGDGTYTLTNANGDSITVDVVDDVVTNIQNQGDIYNEIINVIEAESDELVDLGNGKYKHIAADGNEVEFDVNTVNLEKVVDADGNVSYIFKDGNDNEITTIDVADDILENIINEGDIYDEIINLIDLNETLTILTDNGDGTFTYTDEDGNDITFDANTTDLADNGDGTYTLTNANGDSITVDVVGDVVTNIRSQGDIYNEIINVIEAESDELVDLGNGKYKHIAAGGSEVEFDVNTVNLEKVVDADGNVSYIFKDGDNNEITTIDVADDILENIINEGDIYDEIINILDDQTDELVDNNDGTYTHTAVDGTVVIIDANTTSVTVVDGVYTFIDGDNQEITTIDTNADAIAFDDTNSNLGVDNVQDAIDALVNANQSGAGITLVDNGDGTVTLVSENGDDLGTIDKSSLIDNNDGTYTFNNTGDPADDVIIDVPASVINQFDGIINGGPVEVAGDTYNSVEEYFQNLIETEETLTVLTDNNDGTFTYTDENGNDITFDANTTTFTDNGDNTFTFTNDNGDTMTIDTNADAIAFDDSGSNLGADNVQDAIDALVNANQSGAGITLVDNGDGTVTLVSENGDDLGTIDKSSLIDNGDGTYTFNNTGDPADDVIIDVPASVINQFDEIINGGPVEVAGDTYNSVEEYFQNLIETEETLTVLTDNGDGTFTYTDENGNDITFDANTTTFTDNGDNTFTFTNDNGDTMTIDTNADAIAFDDSSSNLGADNVQDAIDALVSANQSGAGITLVDNGDGTVTLVSENGDDLGTIDKSSLIDNGDGTYTFNNTGDPADDVVIDVPASVINQFDEIINGGPVEVAGDTYNSIEEYFQDLIETEETLTVLTDNGDGAFTYTDEDGNDITFDANTTDLVDNGDGSYTLTNANGDSITVDVVDDVVTNIQSQGDIYNEIINVIEAESDELVDLGNGKYKHIAADGSEVEFDVNTVNLEKVVDADGNFSYIFKDGDNNEITIIDVAGDILENIINEGDIYNEIINILDEESDVLVDNNDGTYTHTAVDGEEIIIDANTTSVAVLDGIYTFTDGNGDIITEIDTNADAIAFDDSGSNLGADNVQDAIDALVSANQSGAGVTLIDNGDGTVTLQSENGDDLGTITKSDLTDNNDGTYTFNNTGDPADDVIIDVPASVINQFDEIINGGPVVVNGDTYNTVEEYFQDLIETEETLTVLTDNGNGTFTYTDENGDDITFDANTTDLADNGDGTYTLTNANGDSITVDVVGDVVTNIQNQGDIYNEIINVIEAKSDELVDLGNGEYKHIAADGSEVEFDVNTVNLEKVVDADGNISYIFKDGDNNEITTIDVAGDILENIINEGDIYDEIINLIDINETLTVLTDNGDGTFTYTDEDGNDITFDANTTDLADNGDGTYTLTNANGDSITVDVVGDVVTNIQNQGDIYNEIINVIEAESDELVDLGNGKYKHIAADGSEVEFDVNTVNLEKVVDADGNVSYIFKDGDNNEITTIDVAGDILENIINEGDIYDEIINLIDLNETLTVLTDNGEGTFTYTDEDGNDITFDANTTDLVDNGDGSYTLTNANGDSITVDVVGDVVTNIQNQGDIYNEIINVIEAESDELVDLGNGKYKHIAADGSEVEFDVNTVNLEKVVDADGNVSYIFKDGDNNEITTIDVAGDILENIINEGDIYDEIINLIDINETLTVLTDNGDGTFTYTDEDGNDITFDANTTDLADNGDGSYTLTNANGDSITVDVVDDVVTNIQNQGDIYNEIINVIEAESDELVDLGNGKYKHIAADGSEVEFDVNTVNLEKVVDADGNVSYIFKDADNNEITTIDVAGDILENIINEGDIYDEIINLIDINETLTVLTDNGDGTFTYTDEDGNDITFDANTTDLADNGDGTYTLTNANGDSITVDVVGDVVTNIQNQGDIYNEIINVIEAESDELVDLGNGKYKHIAADGSEVEFDVNTVNLEKVVDADGNVSYIFKDGDNNEITTIDVAGDILENIINEGDIYDEIINLIDLNETLTVLTDNGDGTFTYTDEDGNAITFDANTTDLADNGDGSYTLTNANGDSITVDVVDDVVTNIQNQGDIYNEIINVIEAESDELVDLGNGKYKHIAADGSEVEFDVNTVNLEKVVDADGNVSYIFKDGDNNEITTIDVAGDILENIINEGDIYEAIINILDDQSDILVDNNDGTYTHTAVDGTVVNIDANTTSVAVVDGVYTFTDAAGNTITEIDTNAIASGYDNTGSGLAADNVQDAIDELADQTDVFVDNGDGTFTHTTVDGDEVTFDANTTDLADNGDGTYTLTNANGDSITVDVVDDVVTNIQNQGDIYNEIINVIEAESDELVDLGNGKYKHIAADGSEVEFDVNTVNLEKVVDADGNVSYIFKDADNNEITTIDVAGDILENIINEGDIYDEIINLIDINETLTILTDNGDGTFTYTDEDGNAITFDANTTDLADNGDGSYTLTNANGDSITVDVIEDVVTNIQNQNDIYNEIINILEEESDVLVDNNDGTYTHTAVDGEEIIIDANTTSVSVEDGVYTFTDGNGDVITTIDTNASASGYDNTDSGLASDNVQDAIDELVNSLESGAGVVLLDNGDGTITLESENGDDLGTITKSDLTDNNDGTYTFNNTGDPADDVVIDVPASVINQFEEIVNGGPVQVDGNTYTTVEEYFQNLIEVNETLTELTYDSAVNELSFKDEDEVIHNIQLNNTSLTYDETNQELVYVNSEGNTSTIDLNNLVNSNIDTGDLITDIDERIDIVNGEDALLHDVKIDVNEANLRLQNIGGTLQVSQIQNGAAGQILVTNEGGNGVTWANPIAIAKGDLTSDDIEVTNGVDAIFRDVALEIKNGAITTDKLDDAAVTTGNIASEGADKVMITDDNGNVTWIDQTNMVSDNETLTVLTDNGDGTFTYTDEEGNDVTIDANTTSVTVEDGIYTFTDASGNVIITIDTNADAIAFDNATNDFVSDNVQDALEELATDLADGAGVTLEDNNDGTFTLESENGDNLGTVNKADLTDAGDGSYTFTNGDGNDIEFDVNTVDVSFNDTTNEYEFKDSNGDVIGTIDMNAGNVAYDNTGSDLTSENVQNALDELASQTDELVDNNDGTYTHTAVDGTVVTIDANTTSVTVADGIYTFTDASGSAITTIDTNADAIAFDNATNDFVSDNVQEALEELATNLADGAGVTLNDNNDGTFTLESENGDDLGTINKADLTDAGDGSYTFTNGDGNDIEFDVNTVDVSFNATTNEYEFKDSNGDVIGTIDMNADNVAYDGTDSGLTAENVQDALDELASQTDELVDNADGTYTHTAVDGTVVTIDANTTSVTVEDGIYTFRDGNGNIITEIDTNADAIAFDNATNDFVADNVQEALEELATNLADGAGVTLNDNSDGTFTLESENGDNLGTINKADLTDAGDGSYTFTNGDANDIEFDVNTVDVSFNDTTNEYEFKDSNGDVIGTIDMNADNVAYDGTDSGLTAENVQDALDELASQTDELVDNADGTYTHTAVDGSVITIDANTTSVTVEDGVYTFTDASGNVMTTIDTNADAIAFDSTNNDFTSTDVQGALEELLNTIDANKGDLTVDGGLEFTGATDGLNKLLADAGIQIADGGITTDKLADEAVTNDKIGADAITTDKILDGEVKATDLGADGGDAGKVATVNADGTVSYQDILTESLADAKGITTDGVIKVNGADELLESVLLDTELSIVDGGITTEKLDDDAVTNGKVAADAITTDKIENATILPEDIATADPDQVLTTDVNGNPIWINQSDVGEILNATNGLTKDELDIKLGGELTEPTTITTDETNTLAVAGLEDGAVDDQLVVAEADGTLRQVKAAMPKFFYMPAVIFDTSSEVTGETRDLHAEYEAQFTGSSNPTLVSSAGATNAIPTLPANELEYHITYYDTDVFANLSIDANGVLTYDIIGNATEASYMTIVFVVK